MRSCRAKKAPDVTCSQSARAARGQVTSAEPGLRVKPRRWPRGGGVQGAGGSRCRRLPSSPRDRLLKGPRGVRDPASRKPSRPRAPRHPGPQPRRTEPGRSSRATPGATSFPPARAGAGAAPHFARPLLARGRRGGALPRPGRGVLPAAAALAPPRPPQDGAGAPAPGRTGDPQRRAGCLGSHIRELRGRAPQDAAAPTTPALLLPWKAAPTTPVRVVEGPSSADSCGNTSARAAGRGESVAGRTHG